MAKGTARKKGRVRTWVQIAFFALSNGYAAGFARGNIYRGPLKFACVPGLNCYSCPGALGSCPIGAFQSVLASRDYQFAFYISGFLIFFGAVLGRLTCGWLCPFGLVQDLLHRIPFPKKRILLPGDKWLKYLKYAILAGFVIVLPLTVLDIVGQGQPWFCKYICPSGTLFAGIPLIAANPPLQAALGWLFTWKAAILLVLVLLSLWIYRPFCRYLCPLGAIYGFFNPIALYRFQVDQDKCTRCGACQNVCKFHINVWETPNSADCIRCGACLHACPSGAIRSTFQRKAGGAAKKEGRAP